MKKRTYTEIELNNKELKEAIIKQLNKDGIKVKSDDIELNCIPDLFDSTCFGGGFGGGFNYSNLGVTITIPKENKIKSIKSFDLFKPKQKWVTKAIVNYLDIKNSNIDIKYGNFGLEGIRALVTKTKKAKKSTEKK